MLSWEGSSVEYPALLMLGGCKSYVLGQSMPWTAVSAWSRRGGSWLDRAAGVQAAAFWSSACHWQLATGNYLIRAQRRRFSVSGVDLMVAQAAGPTATMIASSPSRSASSSGGCSSDSGQVDDDDAWSDGAWCLPTGGCAACVPPRTPK